MKQTGIIVEGDRLRKLSQLGDPLEKLERAINWQMFEIRLNLVFEKEPKGADGRLPCSYLLLFKILILQQLFNISDDQAEFQINDRVSFKRFLGLSLGDPVPDAKTIRLFRDTLVKADVKRELFDLYFRKLEEQGIITHSGSFVEATFVETP